MVASHNHFLVILSVLISILAAYATIALVERLRDARGRLWLAWLIGGAVVDGLGTWSMHYTGMLALRLPVPVWYDWPTVILSLIVGSAGSGAAFLVLSRKRNTVASGFCGEYFPGGTSVLGMRERAHLLGGQITINGIKGKGTVIMVSVPKFRKSSKSDRYFSNKNFL